MDLDTLRVTDLSSQELSALSKYKTAEEDEDGMSKCFELNRELRNGIFVDELSTSLREVAESLDSVFRRCPVLTNSLTVYRGTGFRKTLPLHEVGKRFRSLEFWSTALSEDPLEQFLKLGPHAAILELHLRTGVPAYNLETLTGAGGSEQELLLPRGILWRVAQVKPETVSPFLKSTKVESLCRAVLEVETWP
jgi:ADP-ribosyltransferase exoenzyme